MIERPQAVAVNWSSWLEASVESQDSTRGSGGGGGGGGGGRGGLQVGSSGLQVWANAEGLAGRASKREASNSSAFAFM